MRFRIIYDWQREDWNLYSFENGKRRLISWFDTLDDAIKRQSQVINDRNYRKKNTTH